MVGPSTVSHRPRVRTAPEVVAPTNRVNVALPFSSFHVEEPSRELVELVDVVAELVAMLETLAPVPEAERLRERVQALKVRLG
jgi:hypothetical protein